ncbi:MAG: YIP1 family protein [Methanoregula sp.]|nr:YIP1 family protein [Methanoregula sp.]
MGSSLLDLLINPNRFFQNTLGDTEHLKIPAVIILLGAIIGAAYGYFAGSLTASMMDSAMPGMGAFLIIAAVVGAFLGTFLFWIVWAGLFYLISRIFKGEGSFNRCLEVVGYGYVPQLIGGVVTLIAAVAYLPKVVVPQLTSAALQDPALLTAATKSLMQDPAMLAYTQIAAVVSIVFLLWSANAWIFGIRQARKLSMRDAAICVGAPVIVFVLYLAYTMAGA